MNTTDTMSVTVHQGDTDGKNLPSFPINKEGLINFIQSTMITEGGHNAELGNHVQGVEEAIARANETESSINEFNALIDDTRKKLSAAIPTKKIKQGKVGKMTTTADEKFQKMSIAQRTATGFAIGTVVPIVGNVIGAIGGAAYPMLRRFGGEVIAESSFSAEVAEGRISELAKLLQEVVDESRETVELLIEAGSRLEAYIGEKQQQLETIKNFLKTGDILDDNQRTLLERRKYEIEQRISRQSEQLQHIGTNITLYSSAGGKLMEDATPALEELTMSALTLKTAESADNVVTSNEGLRKMREEAAVASATMTANAAEKLSKELDFGGGISAQAQSELKNQNNKIQAATGKIRKQAQIGMGGTGALLLQALQEEDVTRKEEDEDGFQQEAASE